MKNYQPIWQSLSPEDHEFHYNPQHAFPDFAQSRLFREPANEAARASLDVVSDVPYGSHDLHRLDIYKAARKDAPVHVFIHGGYWRAQDKSNFAFVAGALIPHGITTVIMNYELCPASTLDGVVASAVAGFDWIASNIGDYGGNPEHLTLSGHSAGAHLGASIMTHGWPTPASIHLRGAVLTSGIFDPTPAIRTSVNNDLHLDEIIAARHNLETKEAVLRPDVTILAGAREPWHFVDQSFRYYNVLRQQGLEPDLHVLKGYDHFDILNEYLDTDSQTMRSILSHCAAENGA